MIVISGALVLVALVLLLVGLLQPDLAFIYASIVLSLVSFGFLIRGVLQRRGETFEDGEATLADAPAAEATPPSQDAAVGRGATARDTAASDARALQNAETGQDDGPTQDERVAVTTAAADTAQVTLVATAAAETSQRDEAVAGRVLVVAGRPRYHVSGCRYITGRDVSEIAVATARVEGFTSCGVCKPDLALAGNPAVVEDVPGNARPAAVDVPIEDAPGKEALTSQTDAAHTGVADTGVADTGVADTDPAAQPAVVEPAVVKVVPSARRATRRAAAPSATASPVEVIEPVATSPEAVKGALPTTLTPARRSPARRAPARKAPARKAPARTVPAKKAAPVLTPATSPKATPLTGTPSTGTPPTGTPPTVTLAAKSATRGTARTRATTSSTAVDPKRSTTRHGSVVVIPDRGRFHHSECRFVRGVEGVQVLSRTAAARSGYQACGVCKP